MKIQCAYCSSYISDTDANCPSCGAVNEHLKRVVDGTPKTIAELELWYRARKLPPENVTRFFIGKNYKGARAFGIYEENGRYIVYKNKDDGSRAIRYEGTDEAYAVNELYLKLKSEILNQKAGNIAGRNTTGKRPSRTKHKIRSFFQSVGICVAGAIGIGITAVYPIIGKILISAVITFVVMTIVWGIILSSEKNTKALKKPLRAFLIILSSLMLFSGVFAIAYNVNRVRYYRYGDDVYCTYHGDYYYYDPYYNDYSYVSEYDIPYVFVENRNDYEWSYNNGDWDSTWTSFEDSTYYDTYIDTSSDSDSDYDWDSGSSWDSGSTDWGSDW